MEKDHYIESGILELYVYGLLDEPENLEVSKMAQQHPEVEQEIIAIEKAIINLSASFCPFLSADTFEKIKEKLELKHGKVVAMKPKSKVFLYIGWAASLLLLLGIGYLYTELDKTHNQVVTIENDKSKLKDSINALENKTKLTESALAVVRDAKNTVVALGGQAVAPDAYAKVYWNKETQTVYVDAAGLPEPPQGMVYQVWALKLNPLTPTSIGLLENFTSDNHRIFAVSNAESAEAFGITLEPAGGSPTPTLEQLYTLGKV